MTDDDGGKSLTSHSSTPVSRAFSNLKSRTIERTSNQDRTSNMNINVDIIIITRQHPDDKRSNRGSLRIRKIKGPRKEEFEQKKCVSRH
eukprot:scaffold6671_cov286-Chaetoceros_neogracile.AAC.9